MLHLRTTISEFILDLKAQKLRAFMTTFGIVWGTVAIVVLLAFGMGFKKQLAISMHGIGEHIAIMFPGRTTKPFEGFGIGRPISLSEDDVRLLKTQVQNISEASPEYADNDAKVHYGQNFTNTAVAGVYPIYGEMRNINPEAGGRFINDPDLTDRRRVAVIGDRLKGLLFGETEALGRIIYVGQTPFTVIGIMSKKIQNSSYNRQDQDRVFIPASTFASVYGRAHVNNIIYAVKDPTQAEATGDAVRAALGLRYRFDPTDKDAVWIWDTNEFDKFIFYFFLAFNIFMGLIGSFTLAVGGIGVANIMVIVVQERVKEIGIKRAVGAKKSNIMFQFFMQSFFIILLGSSIGFLIAWGITAAMQFIPIKEFIGTPELSWTVALATAVILAVVGLAAGLMPARKAAQLDVVECLRA